MIFHHLTHLHSHFSQIPHSLGRIGQTVEHSKYKSTQPSLRPIGTPCIGDTYDLKVLSFTASLHDVTVITCLTAKLCRAAAERLQHLQGAPRRQPQAEAEHGPGRRLHDHQPRPRDGFYVIQL